MSWWIYGINWTLLLVSALLALYALYRGPASLNRTVALDLLTAVSMGIIALTTVIHHRNDTMPIFIVMTLVAFLTSTSVARIVSQQQAARKQKASRKASDEATSAAEGEQVKASAASEKETAAEVEESDLELSDLAPGGDRDE